MNGTERPYVVVMADGEGGRVVPLTRALYGVDLPRQFAVIEGELSSLQTTVERAAAQTSLDRILVVVNAHHEPVARTQLAPYEGVELVVQPSKLDTAAGVLLPVVRILAREWNARVIFLPSDHYISNSKPIFNALRITNEGILQDRVALVGVPPTESDPGHAWIIPGDAIGREGAFTVRRFLEQPSRELVDQPSNTGGLWNTFIQTGPARVFWGLFQRYLPTHAAALERYLVEIDGPEEHAALHHAYSSMTPASFIDDVLAHTTCSAVVPVADTGWSDWGSPQRVFASLLGTTSYDRLVERIRGGQRTDALRIAR